MLKLEKKSSGNEIGIIIHDKATLFTKPFWVALCIAGFFHLLFLSLFHVAPFKIKWGETLFPPIEVEADFPYDPSIVAVDLESLKLPAIGFIPQLISEPKVAKDPSISPPIALEFIQANKVGSESIYLFFESIEKEIYEPVFNPLNHIVKDPITLVISGPIGGFSLENDPLKNMPLPKIKFAHDYKDKINQNEKLLETRAVFKVALNSVTGTIFWIEMTEKTGILKLDQFAEAIVKDLRFLKDESVRFASLEKSKNVNFINHQINGQIELFFNLDIGDQ